jgi:hypothetical protein
MSGLRHQEVQLARRRLALVVQCRQQRKLLLDHGRELEGLIKILDSGVQVGSAIRRNPGIALGAALAVLVVIKPRRAIGALCSVLTALRTWGAVGPLMRLLR